MSAKSLRLDRERARRNRVAERRTARNKKSTTNAITNLAYNAILKESK